MPLDLGRIPASWPIPRRKRSMQDRLFRLQLGRQGRQGVVDLELFDIGALIGLAIPVELAVAERLWPAGVGLRLAAIVAFPAAHDAFPSTLREA